jgi:hypothetical protein
MDIKGIKGIFPEYENTGNNGYNSLNAPKNMNVRENNLSNNNVNAVPVNLSEWEQMSLNNENKTKTWRLKSGENIKPVLHSQGGAKKTRRKNKKNKSKKNKSKKNNRK